MEQSWEILQVRLETNDARKRFFLSKKLNIFKIISSGRSSRGKLDVFLRFAVGMIREIFSSEILARIDITSSILLLFLD